MVILTGRAACAVRWLLAAVLAYQVWQAGNNAGGWTEAGETPIPMAQLWAVAAAKAQRQ